MKIICAFQNETVRKGAGEDNIELATVGLDTCLAILIADKIGNISLTHVDSLTDLSFVCDEVALMKGAYTIDIIGKNSFVSSPLTHHLKEFIQLKFPDVVNLKGEKTIRNSPNGTVLFRQGKIYSPEPMKLQRQELGAIEAGKNPQLRIYGRQLSMMLSEEHVRQKPDIVYSDGKWADNLRYCSLDDRTKIIYKAVATVVDRPNDLKKRLEIFKLIANLNDPNVLTYYRNTINRYKAHEEKLQKTIN